MLFRSVEDCKIPQELDAKIFFYTDRGEKPAVGWEYGDCTVLTVEPEPEIVYTISEEKE